MLSSACLIFIAGLLPLLWLPVIPSLPWIVGLLGVALILLLRHEPGAKKGGLFLLAVCWGCLAASQSLIFFQKIPEKPVSADVVVTRSDGQQYHEVKIVRLSGKPLFPQPGVRVYGARLPAPVCAGQRLRLKLKLRPLHGQLNEGGFDSQRFYLAQNLLFSGRVIAAETLSSHCSLPSQWMSAVQRRTSGLSMQGIIIALAFGERQGLSAEQKQLLNQTGTAHLMAISGMHISLAAGLGWLIGRACQLIISAHRIGYRFPLLCSMVMALGYTWLSGCNPPALRAMFALTIWSILRLSGRKWISWDVWLLCIAGILLHDPLVLLSDSFCLSALAVASLLFWYQWVPLSGQVRRWPWYIRYPAQLVHLQLGIMLLLLPLQIKIFHGFSISALVANFFAVPLISFIVVPLILIALFLNDVFQLGVWLWLATDSVLRFLFYLLESLPEGWLAVEKRMLWVSLVGWVGVVLWRTGAWKHSKAAILVAITAVTLGHQRSLAPPQVWQMTMLDIGHGLAVAIIRNHRVLLYDTGGAWTGGDAALQTSNAMAEAFKAAKGE